MFGFIKKIMGNTSDESLVTYLEAGALLIDVRSFSEFASGSVAGAKNIPLNQLEDKLSVLPKDKPIVLFCRSGMRSGQAKRLLEKNGYSQVLNGGTWQSVAKAINK